MSSEKIFSQTRFQSRSSSCPEAVSSLSLIHILKDGLLHLDNGKLLHLKTAADFIEVGELRELELCAGDLIQFNVNLRERKIYNGSLARVTDDPEKVMLLYSDGRKRELVEMPKGYAAFKYGWVTTSHKSQGQMCIRDRF